MRYFLFDILAALPVCPIDLDFGISWVKAFKLLHTQSKVVVSRGECNLEVFFACDHGAGIIVVHIFPIHQRKSWAKHELIYEDGTSHGIQTDYHGNRDDTTIDRLKHGCLFLSRVEEAHGLSKLISLEHLAFAVLQVILA